MRECDTCHNEIPAARIKALPLTTKCVECSDEKKVKGHLDWHGKHAPVLRVVDGDSFRKGRRGFHAHIGANSVNNPRILKSETASAEVRNLSLELRTERVEAEAVNRPPARCHPDEPRVNPAGDCLACALAKQRLRLRQP
jgi:hypothetical protein